MPSSLYVVAGQFISQLQTLQQLFLVQFLNKIPLNLPSPPLPYPPLPSPTLPSPPLPYPTLPYPPLPYPPLPYPSLPFPSPSIKTPNSHNALRASFNIWGGSGVKKIYVHS